jgi:hypothetical protein
MREYLRNHIIVGLYFLSCAILLVITAWYVHYSHKTFTSDLVKRLDDRIEHINSLIGFIDNNAADEEISSIIVDCQSRQEFESLLSQLGNASDKELLTTQQLFDSCSRYYTIKKSLMVNKLSQEVSLFSDDIDLLSKIEDTHSYNNTHDHIVQILEAEKVRASLLEEQVELQGKIITALISKEDRSITISPSVQRAGQISEQLSVLDKQIDTMRTNLDEK